MIGRWTRFLPNLVGGAGKMKSNVQSSPIDHFANSLFKVGAGTGYKRKCSPARNVTGCPLARSPFRESRSIRPEVRYRMWTNKMQDVRDWIERLSPETTKRGVVDILRLTPESFKFTRGPARTCTDNLPLSLGELRPISINLEAWPSPVAGDNGGGSLTSVNHLCP
jgi:hypothetical protein